MKFLRSISHIVFITYLAINTALAYTLLDEATINLSLPKNWKSKDITRNKDMISTTYEKTKTNNEPDESLVEVDLKKEKGKDPIEAINEMANTLIKQGTEQHCKVDPLIIRPQSNEKIRVWRQEIQCKKSQASIIQLYIDADPKMLYLFTYTTGYPLTEKLQNTANDVFKSIHICYQKNDCKPLD